MHDSSPLVFGTAPTGVDCRDRAAAYSVVRNGDGRVAAVCANVCGRDQFWLPGGGMLDRETPEQTIAREVREELGRPVRLQRKLGWAIQFFFAGDQDCWYKMTADFFVGEFDGDSDSRGEYDLHWVDPLLPETAFFHECHVWAALEAVRE